MAWQTVQDPDGQFIGWAPGRGAIVAPDGMPWRLERGADLVIELHMLAAKRPAVVNPSIALFASAAPPVRTPVTVKMTSKLIDIPAGATDHEVTDAYELPVAVELMSVYPHAHYLGKDMRVTATWPDGATKTLLHIPRWNFHWQQDYRYRTPIALPRGTVLKMRYTYDNSADNEDNPHAPPVRVRLGPSSSDEMAELGLQVLTASIADAARLVQSFDDRDAEANVALGEARVREQPGSAKYRAFLGKSYVEAGRPSDAVPHLEAAIRLNPTAAGAESDLGSALMDLNRVADALPHLRRAADLMPNSAVVHSNCASVLAASGRYADALRETRRALELNPEYAPARENLARLQSMGVR